MCGRNLKNNLIVLQTGRIYFVVRHSSWTHSIEQSVMNTFQFSVGTDRFGGSFIFRLYLNKDIYKYTKKLSDSNMIQTL